MAAELNLSLFMSLLNNYGISTLLGPFLVIFTMIYGLLHKIGIFKNQERIMVAISFVFSLYYIYSTNNIIFTQRFFAMFFYEILTILLVLIAFSIFARNPTGGEDTRKKRQAIFSGVLGLSVVIAALYAFKGNPTAVGMISKLILESLYKYLIETGLFTFLVLVGVFIMLTRWLTDDSKKKKKEKNWKKKVGRYFVLPAEILDEAVSKKK